MIMRREQVGRTAGFCIAIAYVFALVYVLLNVYMLWLPIALYIILVFSTYVLLRWLAAAGGVAARIVLVRSIIQGYVAGSSIIFAFLLFFAVAGLIAFTSPRIW